MKIKQLWCILSAVLVWTLPAEVWFVEKFDTFNSGAVPASGSGESCLFTSVGGTEIVVSEEAPGSKNKVLNISRSKGHGALRLAGKTPMPENSTWNIGMNIKAQRAFYLMLKDKDGKAVIQLAFGANKKLTYFNQKKWVDCGLKLSPNWMACEIIANRNAGTFIVVLKDLKGSSQSSAAIPLLSRNLPVQLELGNALPAGGTPAVIDNVGVYYKLQVQKSTAIRLKDLPPPVLTPEGNIVWFKQDFENKEYFAPGKMVDHADPFTGYALDLKVPHTQIVSGLDGNDTQAMKIIRIDPSLMFTFKGVREIPAGRDFSVSVRIYLPREKGASYFFIDNAQKQRLFAVNVAANQLLKVYNSGEIWGVHPIMIKDGWIRLKIDFKVNNSSAVLYVYDAQEKLIGTLEQPMVRPGTISEIRFGNILPAGTYAVIDDVEVTYAPARSLENREELAAASQLTGKNFSDPAGAVNDSGAVLTGDQGELTLDLPKLGLASSLRLAAPETVRISVRGLNNMGQQVDIADNSQWLKVMPDVRQLDFKAANLRSLFLSVSGKAGEKISKLELYADEVINQNDQNAAFARKVYGEFHLPVYAGNKAAELHLFNVSGAAIPVKVVLSDRFSNKSYPALTQDVKLVPGKNIISIPVENLVQSHYVAQITDESRPELSGKPMFRRLLRREIVPEPQAAELTDVSGLRMYFPDDYYFADSRNLTYEPVKNKVHKVAPDHLVPGLLMQGCDGFSLQDGKLHFYVRLYDNYFRMDSRRRFLATADLSNLDNWDIREVDRNCEMPRSPNDVQENVQSFDNRPKPGPDGKIKYRFYDPERDGKVNLRQVDFKYIHWMGEGTTEGEAFQDWGIIIPPKRTTWPIWYKAPGEAIVLQKTPLLNDERASGDFEDPADSNDNFAGMYLSDDGNTLYYVRGHVVRRHPPYNVPFDNLAIGLRLLTVYKTTDGVNYETATMAIPQDDEPLVGTQHYGATLMRMKKGRGLRMAIVSRYYAQDQRIFLDLAYSWDGFNWKRNRANVPFLDNTPPGSWLSGGMFSGSAVVNHLDRTFFTIGWACSAYHVFAELMWTRNLDTVTGPFVRGYLANRGIEGWPIMKKFKDYDEMAAYVRNSIINTGVIEFRRDGFFPVSSADGSFVTHKLAGKGSLTANCEAQKITFKLLDADDQLIPGYEKSFENVNDVALKVFDTLPAGEFKLACELVNATVYTLDF